MGVCASPRRLATRPAKRTRSCTQLFLLWLPARLLPFLFSELQPPPPIRLELFPFPNAMAPTKKGRGKKLAPSSYAPPAAAPAVDRSIILNPEALDKVHSALASIFNECGRTTVWPASRAFLARTVTEVRFFADALWAGLVPPFSDFFNAVLSHYQIHMMHLGPESITLLAVFAFVCEAMVGIPPIIDLLCHFFSLRLRDPTQCLGCVSFLAALETAASGTDFGLPPPTSGFRERWLYVDVEVPSPLLSHPTLPAIPNSGWDHEKLTSPRLAFV